MSGGASGTAERSAARRYFSSRPVAASCMLRSADVAGESRRRPVRRLSGAHRGNRGSAASPRGDSDLRRERSSGSQGRHLGGERRPIRRRSSQRWRAGSRRCRLTLRSAALVTAPSRWPSSARNLRSPVSILLEGYGLTVFAAMNLVRHGTTSRSRRTCQEYSLARRGAGLRNHRARRRLRTLPESRRGLAALKPGTRSRARRYSRRVPESPGRSFTCSRAGEPGRTQTGLSVLLVPNDAPGVELRRIRAGGRHMLGTYESFFNVEVPDSALIGLGGWLGRRHVESRTRAVLASCANAPVPRGRRLSSLSS